MLSRLLDLAVDAGLPGVSRNSKREIKISIPNDHPHAADVIQLAQFLASSIHYQSGIVIEQDSPLSKEDTQRQFLDLLRKLIDPEVVDYIEEKAQQWEKEQTDHDALQRTAQVSGIMGNPLDLADMLEAPLKAGAFADANRKNKNWITNVATHLRHKHG